MRPSRRLILQCGLLALVVALMATAASALRVKALGMPGICALIGGFTAAALIDLILLWRQPTPRVERQLPRQLALGRTLRVALRISADIRHAVPIQVIDHVPEGLTVIAEPPPAQLEPGQPLQLDYPVQASQRGHFRFSRCELLLGSGRGLWQSRRLVAVASELRAYPDFARLYGDLDSPQPGRIGVRTAPRRGLGQEFHQLREYREGDSSRQIDWKATARKRQPISREYQDERDQQVLILLDCGRRMRSQDGPSSHFDQAIEAALRLSQVALRQGDAVGLLAFAATTLRQVPPRRGQEQLNRLLNALYDLESRAEPADSATALSETLARYSRHALVILITTLRDEEDAELLPALQVARRRHRLLLVDLREAVLDEVHQRPVGSLDEALEYCGGIDYAAARQRLHQRLRLGGAPVLDSNPRQLGAALVNRYLAIKREGSL